MREALAAHVNERGGAKATADDIIFFNGVGDAVSKVYGFLNPEARVIGPTPAYSTHSSAESAHCARPHLMYDLVPENGWLPDMEDLTRKVRENPAISGILLINPNNPTGAVYPVELQQIVDLAAKYNLFLVADEIYIHMIFPGAKSVHLSEVLGDVPAIVMRGISKEIPWPGSRCGWIEVLNRDKDQNFSRYLDAVVAAKRLEVCSTSGPQLTIPRIFADPRYPAHLAARAEMFASRAAEACEILGDIPGTSLVPPQGAFYMSLLFDDGVINGRQSLRIDDPALRETIERLADNVAPDLRFVYYLLGTTGICVVPLSGFCSSHPGFRFTVLETDDEKRRWTMRTLASALREYVASA